MNRQSISMLGIGTLILCGNLLLNIPTASADTLPEYQVKAAFLYNFAKFVEWPAQTFDQSGDSLVVGILGKDPFGESLESAWAGKLVQDKKLVFKQLSETQQALECHMVYISASEHGRVGEIINTLKDHPVLTVSDIEGFIQRGGMIGLVVTNRKVSFNINQTAASKTGLKISSQLLKLAKVIAKTIQHKPIA